MGDEDKGGGKARDGEIALSDTVESSSLEGDVWPSGGSSQEAPIALTTPDTAHVEQTPKTAAHDEMAIALTTPDTAHVEQTPKTAAHDEMAIAATQADTDRGALPPARVTMPMSSEEAALPSGPRYGRFIATDKLGVGGMGTVYAAHDPDLDRKVAIKVLHRARASESGQQRLLREAQAMAKLAHPNVITVHEVGTREGQAYVVMEYVDGGTLRKWVKGKSWKEILEAYVAAGEGLVAAHEVSLVHRDFKPDNVLVRSDGRVLVTDFGIVGVTGGEAPGGASGSLGATSQGGSVPSSSKLALPLTRTGEVMGTPIYMAPEQHAGKSVDARADQYAFCVALYEALYGVRPYSGETYYELVDRLTKGLREPPPADSEVPSWIEGVLVRGMASDPDERFDDMRALLEVLRSGAVPRRRRWPLFAAGALLVALAVGVGVAVALRSRVRCDAPSAELAKVWAEATRAQVAGALGSRPKIAASVRGTLDDYARRWEAMRQEACEATHLRGEQSPQVLDQRMHCLRNRLAGLRAAVEGLSSLEETSLHRAFPLVSRLPRLAYCRADALSTASGLPTPKMREEALDIQAQVDRAAVQLALGRVAEARKEIDAAQKRAEALGYGPLVLDARYNAAMVAVQENKKSEAVEALREVATKAAKAKVHRVEYDALLSLIYLLGHTLGQTDAALALVPSAEVASSAAGGEPARRARLAGNVGLALLRKGDYHRARAQLEEAVRLLRQANGDEDLETLSARHNLGLVFAQMGDHARAKAIFEAGLAAREAQLFSDHPDLATTLDALGNTLHALEQKPAAEKALRRALAIRRKVLGSTHARTVQSLNNLAIVLADMGKGDEALKLAREAVQQAKAAHGKDSPEIAGPLNTIGDLLRARGKNREAWAAYAKALANIEYAWGKQHIASAPLLENLARIAIDINQAQMAFGFIDRAIALRAKVEGAAHPSLMEAYALRGSFHLKQGRTKEAQEDFSRMRKAAVDRYGHAHADVARADYNLAIAQEKATTYDDASASYQRALTMLQRVAPQSPLIVNAWRGLGDVATAQKQHDAAIAHYGEAVKAAARAHHPQHGDVLHMLAGAHVAKKQWREAAASLELAMTLRQAAKRPLLYALAQFELAKVLWAGRLDRKRAETLQRAARKVFVEAGGDAKGNVEEIDAWKKKRR